MFDLQTTHIYITRVNPDPVSLTQSGMNLLVSKCYWIDILYNFSTVMQYHENPLCIDNWIAEGLILLCFCLFCFCLFICFVDCMRSCLAQRTTVFATLRARAVKFESKQAEQDERPDVKSFDCFQPQHSRNFDIMTVHQLPLLRQVINSCSPAKINLFFSSKTIYLPSNTVSVPMRV